MKGKYYLPPEPRPIPILSTTVPSKIYPGYPGDIPDIFFDFFNKNFPENISGISGVKVSKSLKKFLKVYIFFHFTKNKIP